MQHKIAMSAPGVLMVLGGQQLTQAAVVCSQNFAARVTLLSASAGPATFMQLTNDTGGSNWQIQGGSGGSGLSGTGGVENNGVAGSQALFADWNHSPSAEALGFFTFNQYTVYGLPGFVSDTTLADITVSMGLLIDGSSTNNPLTIQFQGTGGNRSFVPTLTNGQYTHVSLMLDQATGGTPNLTGSYNLQVSHGAGGFGFDAGNIVRIDNVVIENRVPEPATWLCSSWAGSVSWQVDAAIRIRPNSRSALRENRIWSHLICDALAAGSAPVARVDSTNGNSRIPKHNEYHIEP